MHEPVFATLKDFLLYADQVARALGWRLDRDVWKDSQTKRAHLIREPHERLMLDGEEYDGRSRIGVHLSEPRRGGHGYNFWSSFEAYRMEYSDRGKGQPKITVAGSTPAIKLAKHITTRLLPKCEAFYEFVAEQLVLDRKQEENEKIAKGVREKLNALSRDVSSVYVKRVDAHAEGFSVYVDLSLESWELACSIIEYIRLAGFKANRDGQRAIPIVDWGAVLEILHDNQEKALEGEAEPIQVEDAIAKSLEQGRLF